MPISHFQTAIMVLRHRSTLLHWKPITQLVECTEGYQSLSPGPPKAGSGPSEHRLKMFTLNRKDWLSVAVTWAWSKRVNSYNRQIYYREYKNICNAVRRRAPVIRTSPHPRHVRNGCCMQVYFDMHGGNNKAS
jgi:hypothetical protein